jgi:single-stranded-DNA-specific exonuclease
LASRLRDLPKAWATVIISDLGIDGGKEKEVKDAFREASKSHKIIYIDHHALPRGITKKALQCEEFVFRRKKSTSELAMDYFKPPEHLEYIALLGAICDYFEHTPKMRRLLGKYGYRKAYTEAQRLDLALEVSREDHPFKRSVIEGLVQGLWPSFIPSLLDRSRFALKQEVALRNYVRENVHKNGKNVAFVTDVPFVGTGKAALYAVEIVNAEIGIATVRDDDHLRLSVRRNKRSNLNLRALVDKATLKSGGGGGGHIAAAGGRVPIGKFDSFIKNHEGEHPCAKSVLMGVVKLIIVQSSR